LNLLLDLLREIVRIFDANTSGIDKLEETGVVFQEMRHPISRNAGLVIDDGNPAASQPIQQARLAHVRATDDHHLRDRHGVSRAAGAERSATPRIIVESAAAARGSSPTGRSSLYCLTAALVQEFWHG